MKTFSLLVLLILSCACGSPFEKGPLTYVTSSNAAIEAEITNLLGSKSCFRCHSVGQLMGGIVPGNPDASKTFQRVADGSMPQRPLPPMPAADVTRLREYIIALAEPTPTPQPQLEGYALVKEQFVDKKCVGCHAGLAKEETIPKSWLNKGSPETSKLYLSVANDRMPKWYDHATSLELQLVSDYIAEFGKPERTVTHQQLFDQLLKPKCLKCHQGITTEEGVARWVAPGNPQGSRLYDALEKQRMPKRIPKATEVEKQLLYNYIKNLH